MPVFQCKHQILTSLMGVHGWFANVLDCKLSSGHGSASGGNRVTNSSNCFSGLPSQHLCTLTSACLAFVCTLRAKTCACQQSLVYLLMREGLTANAHGYWKNCKWWLWLLLMEEVFFPTDPLLMSGAAPASGAENLPTHFLSSVNDSLSRHWPLQ